LFWAHPDFSSMDNGGLPVGAGGKMPVHGPDQSTPSSFEVKNDWNLPPVPPVRLHGTDRNNCTSFISMIFYVPPHFLSKNAGVFIPLYASRDSSISIATGYGLDGPGIECLWGRNFPHPSRLVMWPTQPPSQRVPGLFPGRKAAGAWR
jgi:hypothetical protein